MMFLQPSLDTTRLDQQQETDTRKKLNVPNTVLKFNSAKSTDRNADTERRQTQH